MPGPLLFVAIFLSASLPGCDATWIVSCKYAVGVSCSRTWVIYCWRLLVPHQFDSATTVWIL
jgi:hypothetical protein